MKPRRKERKDKHAGLTLLQSADADSFLDRGRHDSSRAGKRRQIGSVSDKPPSDEGDGTVKPRRKERKDRPAGQLSFSQRKKPPSDEGGGTVKPRRKERKDKHAGLTLLQSADADSFLDRGGHDSSRAGKRRQTGSVSDKPPSDEGDGTVKP